ncbi:MAG: RluA family pseudouridine synthase, partial [Alphaproteobacteria bacterium]|nr:RluA family pseudouridine synthase [Alphaproteobacteria bacterium]
SALGGATRPGVVHRLDKDTSGVMVFAKSDAAFRELVKIFSEHNLTRKYIAFVWGVPNWESADITGNIARSSRNRQKMTMVKTGGKPSHTEVAVVNAWSRAKISQMRCTLFTGRTHQIRLHLSAHGFPVLCDPVYGRGAARLGTVRDADLLEFLKTHDGQMLHAEVLEFSHPTTGELMRFKTRLPDDMLELKYILENI